MTFADIVVSAGVIASAHLGSWPGVQSTVTLTSPHLEIVSTLDLAQKYREPGFSRLWIEEGTFVIGPIVGGARWSQRFGRWSKRSLAYIAGIEHGPLRLVYRDDLWATDPNNVRALDVRYRQTRGRLRLELTYGVVRFDQPRPSGLESRLGWHETFTLGYRFLGGAEATP